MNAGSIRTPVIPMPAQGLHAAWAREPARTTSAYGYVLAGILFLCLSACGDTPPEPRSASVPAKPAPLAPAAEPEATAVAKPAEAVKPDPDRTLAANVKKAIDADPGLKDLGIDVTVTGGVAHLWGTVSKDAERKRAAQVAASVPGVSSVDNRLAVVRGS